MMTMIIVLQSNPVNMNTDGRGIESVHIKGVCVLQVKFNFRLNCFNLG